MADWLNLFGALSAGIHASSKISETPRYSISGGNGAFGQTLEARGSIDDEEVSAEIIRLRAAAERALAGVIGVSDEGELLRAGDQP